jgi:hypothetical protein
MMPRTTSIWMSKSSIWRILLLLKGGLSECEYNNATITHIHRLEDWHILAHFFQCIFNPAFLHSFLTHLQCPSPSLSHRGSVPSLMFTHSFLMFIPDSFTSLSSSPKTSLDLSRQRDLRVGTLKARSWMKYSTALLFLCAWKYNYVLPETCGKMGKPAFQPIRWSCRSSRCIPRYQLPICNIWSLHSRALDISLVGVWNGLFYGYRKLAMSEACSTPLKTLGYVRGVSCSKDTRLQPDLLPLEQVWDQSCYRLGDLEIMFPSNLAP